MNMQICRFNGSRLGVIRDGALHDVTAALAVLPADPWPAPLGDPLIRSLPAVQSAIADILPDAPRIKLDAVRLDSPVARPANILGAPANYELHIEESKADAEIAASGPIRSIGELGLFLKASTSLVGFGDGITVRFPERRTDHEAEFVVVIGRTADAVNEEAALDYVAGYTLGLDVTLRGSEERSFRKSIDSYTVAGPWLVTSDELTDPSAVPFTLSVNGVLRQDANTRDLIYGVRQLIALASSFYVLHPGDLIFTGAPVGVGEIRPGDEIVLASPHIGEGRVAVRAASNGK